MRTKVPHGGVLSLALFSNSLLGLVGTLLNVRISLFADDGSIWTAEKRRAVLNFRLENAFKVTLVYLRAYCLKLFP